MWFRIISLLWSSILFFVETALARSGMFHFLLCFVFFASLFAYVCSGILYGHYGMFLPTFLLRFVLFCWLVCACPVPAFFTVAPACCFYWHVFCTFLFRHVFFSRVSACLILACLRMSCSGMLNGRSGMLSFPACFRSPRLFYWPVYACHVPACFMVAPACFIFRHVSCTFLFRHVSSFRVFRNVWFWHV